MPQPHRIARRLLIAVLAIVGLVVPLTGSGLADASPSHHSGPKPTIVLVHGDWADSSWNAVIPKLQARGYTVVAPPNAVRVECRSTGRADRRDAMITLLSGEPASRTVPGVARTRPAP